VTEFGSFDNSTCKRVLDLLKPGDLTLGQVVIKRVVNTHVNNITHRGGKVQRWHHWAYHQSHYQVEHG